jgi:hypothetical protein
MGWELRNGKRYYYRKIRRGRRVISEYVGASEFSGLWLELDEFDRAEKTQARIAWKDEKDEVKKLNKVINRGNYQWHGSRFASYFWLSSS